MKYREPLELETHAKSLGLGAKYREPALIVGWDTETVEGEPYTAQFSRSDGRRYVLECGGRPEVIRAAFAEILAGAPPRGFVLAGAHYLRFDVQVLFKDRTEFFAGIGEIDWTDENGVHWRGSTSWPVVFVVGRYQGRTLLLLDTFRFFFGSLDSVCRDLQIKQAKLERPRCILEGRAPTEQERPYFLQYAMRDADAVLDVLRWIDRIWRQEDVGPCISIAHQAGRIFRRNHTRVNGRVAGLDAPDHFGQLAGVSAYHGGRNSVRADTWPLIVPGCTMFDVRSMYPWICSELLPSYLSGRWVWSTSPRLQGHGLYRVYGTVERGDCWPYRLIMRADGSYPQPGERLEGEWVTGYELQAALRHGLLADVRYTGYVWERGPARQHPFADYFQRVFSEKEKNREINPALYLYFKYLANSLTGKFVATIPQYQARENGVLEKVRIPGMLFNSPIGAAITGAGRTYLFEAEIATQSIHGATDSIVVPPWGRAPQNIGPKMGQWEEVVEGTFVCGRNKLYAFLGPKTHGGFTGEKNGKKYFRGSEIRKYATHAFQGNVFDFLNLIFSGKNKYKYRRMVHMREAQRRRGLRALTFEAFEAEIRYGGKYGEIAPWHCKAKTRSISR